ncbi:MAG: SGNH/GDSL hydrolase family protein [Muribaculaceae bacterium]|nr:SGNH/GDSL hydrolase family protein [Muribaculaceae bacterium]
MKKLIIALLALTATLSAFSGNNDLTGKTIAFLGDSYVKNHRRPADEAWHSKASANLGMNYVNCGRNGSSIAFDRTKDGFGPAMTERYKTEIPDSANYIVIIAGHNDADYLMNHADQDLWNEFCIGLDTLLDGIQTKFPEARLAFVTPWAVDRPGFTEVNAQILKACGQRVIPVLDMAALGVIDVNNPDFRAKYFQGPNDTAHLNAKGHDLLVPLGEAFLQLISLK